MIAAMFTLFPMDGCDVDEYYEDGDYDYFDDEGDASPDPSNSNTASYYACAQYNHIFDFTQWMMMMTLSYQEGTSLKVIKNLV